MKNEKVKLMIIVTLIFCSTFILDYICIKSNLCYRQWLSLSINYYRYAFLVTVLIILPCYWIKKKRKIWLMILYSPVGIFISFILLVSMCFNRNFYIDSYYTVLKGQKVIAMEDHFSNNVTTIYYVPVNIFFMERSPDFPYPYEP